MLQNFDSNAPVSCLRVKNWLTEAELIVSTTNCMGRFEGDRAFERNQRENKEPVYVPIVKMGCSCWYAVVGGNYKYRVVHCTTMEPKPGVYTTEEEAVEVLMTLDP